MNLPIVLYSLVPDTNAARLERTLPHGYTFEQLPYADGELDMFIVFAGSTQVASVVSGENGFEFLFENNRQARWLKDEMEKIYFSKSLKWLLVFPSYESKWGYMGSPAASKDEALSNIGPLVMKQGAMLIGFHSGEWDKMHNGLSYLHSFQVRGNVENPVVDDTDMGAAMIEFTTLESG